MRERGSRGSPPLAGQGKGGVTLPGVSGSVAAADAGRGGRAVVAVLLPEPRTAARGGVYLLALAVAAIMLGPAVWIGFDIGLNAGPVSAVLFAVFVTLALPLVDAAWPHLPKRCRGGECGLRRFRRCSWC
jgi:hypothetical protein